VLTAKKNVLLTLTGKMQELRHLTLSPANYTRILNSMAVKYNNANLVGILRLLRNFLRI